MPARATIPMQDGSDHPPVALSPADFDRLAERVAEIVEARLANRRRLVDIDTMAEMLSMSARTLQRLVDEGRVRPVRTKRRVLFDPDRVVEELR